MAELAGLVVVHAAQQDHHVLGLSVRVRILLPALRLDQLHQIGQLLNKVGNILCLYAQNRRIAFCQHTGFVLTKVSRHKVLPDQVLRLHDVTIAYDEPCRAVKNMEQAVNMGRNISPCPTGTQHDHLYRTIRREFHSPTSASISKRPRFFSRAGAALSLFRF